MKNKLYQLFKDNVNKGKGIYSEIKEDSADIYLYDAIGGLFGVEAKTFIDELNSLEAENINLHINSPGGDVFEARAIATALQKCKANVTAHIDGVCASAATYIALACNQVEMAEGGFFMIHNAWTIAIGNADDFIELASLLEKVDGAIVRDYEKKTGLKQEDIKEMMAAETWLTADEAKEKGFIDSIYTGEALENQWTLDAYDNAPEKLVNKQEENYDRERFEKRLNLLEKKY